MGRATIEDMLDYTEEDFALHWHLTANHYPPIHECFLPIAQQVIEKAVAAVNDPVVWDGPVLLPNGRTMTVRQIHDGLHLAEFVEARLEREPASDE